ncbi:MAG TPA: SDR family NAD(P)-dependent oxidoreductase [Solimonas sp.]|nr:SDR family NAD(P)-dependent oxidoreductase [Solimonas sp.]
MKSFEGRVAAITGAGSGIGRALALALAARRCHLALSSNSNQKALAETARLAAEHGVKVSFDKVDVASRDQVYAWAEKVVAEHGKVNLLVNNAGVAHAGTVAGSQIADYEWVMGINYWGVVYGTKAFLPHLVASGEGHIVNVSSVFGLFAQPGMSAYNSSKFAVRGFTESLRQELDLAKNGVSATCVHPGGVKTNIAASGRFSDSVGDLTGSDGAAGSKQFEKLLRTTAEEAASQILTGVRKNARRLLIGVDARAADGLQRLLPGSYQKLVTSGLRLLKR